MKKPTIKEAAEFFDLVKVGQYYYSPFYVNGYVGMLPFGEEEVYLSDGVYADSTPSTGKELLAEYIKYIKDNPEEFKS